VENPSVERELTGVGGGGDGSGARERKAVWTMASLQDSRREINGAEVGRQAQLPHLSGSVLVPVSVLLVC
jgi:hypothetical protein